MSALLNKAVAVVLAVALAAIGAFFYGVSVGGSRCEAGHAAADAGARENAARQTIRTLDRSDVVSHKVEAKRSALDAFFQRLTDEAAHESPDPVDSCVLPADRLRRWADANAGMPDPGAAASQPDGAAPAASAPQVGRGARPGEQSPAGGARVPLVGNTVLRPAAVAGDQR